MSSTAVTPPAIDACPTTSRPIAPHCSGPTRSASSGTASNATQTTSVLCTNAVSVDDARLSPSKNNRKGTLPPTTPMRPRAAHCRCPAGRLSRCPDDADSAATTATRAKAATAFFAVVYVAASSKVLTP
jgi:hypothetical protein